MNNNYSLKADNITGKLPGYEAWILGIVLALLIGSFSFAAAGFIADKFVTTGDHDELIVKMELPKFATMQQINLKTQEVEQYILSKSAVLNVFVLKNKTDKQLTQQEKEYTTEIRIKLVDKSKRSSNAGNFLHNIKKELEGKFEGINIDINNIDITAIPMKRRYCLF